MSFTDRHWDHLSWLSVAMLPLAAAFRVAATLRRFLYRAGALESFRLPVPVVVVGNITAGGTGKTPLTLWLCEFLRGHGYRPGIVSRGYGGSGETRAVTPGDYAAAVGDEPALLAGRSGCPVWIGRNRVTAARALLAAHPECNVIVSDDGLQHYRLQRDAEIAVVDGSRGLGNGLPLPAGPLREPASRLREVDAVVINGDRHEPPVPASRCFAMSLEGRTFRNLLNPAHLREASEFQGRRLHAVAGIGNPPRFFRHLQHLGLSFVAHPFPDHHDFTPEDLDFGDAGAILMTEKDAIKCMRFASEDHWLLAVEARVDPGLGQLILDKLAQPHGS